MVAGEAGAAAEAVQKARELSPDVVVLDIRMPDGSGVEACRDIRAENPDVKVLCSPPTVMRKRSWAPSWPGRPSTC